MLERKTNKIIAKHFNKMLFYSIAFNILLFIAGLIMFILPNLSNKLIGIIVGTLFILNGILLTYKYLTRDGAKLYSLNLVFGILSGLIGIILIVYPYAIMNFVTICLGIYMIINGCLTVNYGYWLRIGKDDSWLITIVTGILLALFGILVMFNPFASLTLTQVIGTFLIILAILQISDTFLLKKRADQIMKIFW